MCDVRITNPNATSLRDALSFNTVKNTEPVVTETVQEKTVLPAQDTTVTDHPLKGNVPAANVNFADEDILPSLTQIEQNQSNDPDLLPLLNFDGTSQTEAKEEGYKPEMSKKPSTNKALAHLWFGTLIPKGIEKLAVRSVAKSTEVAVEKSVAAIIAKATSKSSAKSGAVLAKTLEKATEIGLAKTVATVSGKGVATIGLKESAVVAGNLFKGVKASGAAATEIIFKGGFTKAIPNTASALVKTSIGASEKVIEKGLEKGTQLAVEKILAETTGKTITKASQKATAAAISKATTKATTEVAKTSTKAATVGRLMPWIGTAVGVGITIWDTKDAIEKQRDSNVRPISKVLAWSTVGLDVISTATTATGVGAPIGWVATGLSIGTSIASDYLR